MTTPAPTPPPERTLPTEEGWWWVRNANANECAVYVRPWLGIGPLMFQHGGRDFDVDDCPHTFLVRIPTPEQLAAVTAKLAAGQALADRARELDDAADSPWTDDWQERYKVATVAYQDAFEAHLAAFPAGGAR